MLVLHTKCAQSIENYTLIISADDQLKCYRTLLLHSVETNIKPTFKYNRTSLWVLIFEGMHCSNIKLGIMYTFQTLHQTKFNRTRS